MLGVERVGKWKGQGSGKSVTRCSDFTGQQNKSLPIVFNLYAGLAHLPLLSKRAYDYILY